MRKIKRIFVHCTASGQKKTVNDILAEFKSKGWKAPGYHWLVTPDGRKVNILSEDKVSNGVKGYNSISVNVAYIGGIDKEHPKGIDNRTPEQKAALRELLTELKGRYPEAKIMGHRDVSPDKNGNGVVDPWERIKECPCFDAITEYQDL